MKKSHEDITEPISSTIIPVDKRFEENRKWEEGQEFYMLDSGSIDKSHFDSMGFDDICLLIRHMENFLMEHGISQQFMRNYATVDAIFNELDKQKA